MRDVGSAGNVGSTGDVGSSGDQGSVGNVGSVGNAGPSGDVGPAGLEKSARSLLITKGAPSQKLLRAQCCVLLLCFIHQWLAGQLQRNIDLGISAVFTYKDQNGL